MRVNRGLLGWGVFFIVLGGVPLAVSSGAISGDRLRDAWQLWPLILVGIGLGLVLERTRFAIVGGLVIAVTFGLMGGAVLATGFRIPFGGFGCGSGTDGGERFAEFQGEFSGGASIELELSCGELVAHGADGAGWLVSGTSHDGRPPEVVADPARLQVRGPEGDGLALVDGGARWDLSLPRAVPVDVELSLNAGSADLDLAGMELTSISASVNAGDAFVDAGSAAAIDGFSASVNAGSLSMAIPATPDTVGGSVSVNVGSMDLCVPPGTPLRVDVGGSPLGANNLEDRGLVEDDGTWTTPGYAEGPGAVSLSLSVNLGSFTLNPEDGCD